MKQRSPVKPAPSTRAFLHEARQAEHTSLFDALHGYVYARWPYLYIGTGTGEHPLSRILGPLGRWMIRLLAGHPGGVSFADTYHGKAVPLPAATQLVSVQEEVCLTDLEQVIPYRRARDIILQQPDHIVALECPCRAGRPDPCLPLDVCLIVGEPFAGFVVEHHPRRARWITAQEAIDILRAEDERGHAHHAFFKDAMLNRFYAICNCCSCCCGAMEAHRAGVPMLASSGYVSRVDAKRCVGCATCVETCPFGALSVLESVAIVDEEACMGCGVCIERCPEDGLSLLRAPSRGEPLELDSLLDTHQPRSGAAS
jgi:ferredoxin